MLTLPLRAEGVAAGHGIEDDGSGMVVLPPAPCVVFVWKGGSCFSTREENPWFPLSITMIHAPWGFFLCCRGALPPFSFPSDLMPSLTHRLSHLLLVYILIITIISHRVHLSPTNSGAARQQKRPPTHASFDPSLCQPCCDSRTGLCGAALQRRGFFA